jgi:hypothetical protein
VRDLHDKKLKNKITIHPSKQKSVSRYQSYLIDKAERDMLTTAEHFYFNDPKNKGNEESFNFIGLTFQNPDSEVRIVTRVGHGKTVNSAASTTTLADTIDAINDRAKIENAEIVGAGHLHPFPEGHKFLSHQDKETMKTYGTIDPGYLFYVINSLTSEYAVYRWDREINDAIEVHPRIIKTIPILIRDEQDKIVIKNPKQILNPKILERIRRAIRDSILIISATLGTLSIVFFSLAAFKPELVLYSISGAVGCIALFFLHTLWTLKNEFKNQRSEKET